jgi:hypothetical protein
MENGVPTDAAGTDGEPVAVTTVTMLTGGPYNVRGTPKDVEAQIVGASRGSIMQLAWLTEAGTEQSIAVNPRHVVALEPSRGPRAD